MSCWPKRIRQLEAEQVVLLLRETGETETSTRSQMERISTAGNDGGFSLLFERLSFLGTFILEVHQLGVGSGTAKGDTRNRGVQISCIGGMNNQTLPLMRGRGFLVSSNNCC